MNYNIQARATRANAPSQRVLDNGIASFDAVLTTHNNTTRIDSGTFKAARGHHIDETYRINSDYKKTLLSELLAGLKVFIDADKFHKAKYLPVLDCTLANLVHTSKHTLSLVYGRDSADLIQINIIDYLASIKMVHNIIGKPNQYEHNSSWCVATPEYKLLVESHKIEQMFIKGASFLQVCTRKDENGKKETIPKSQWEATERAINLVNRAPFDHNHYWKDSGHSITLNGSPLVPYVFRSFTESLKLGGRFYGRVSSPLGLKSELRTDISISDLVTAEYDFDSLHPNMLYAMAGVDAPEGDLYQVGELKKFKRKTVKSAFLMVINYVNVASWKMCVTKSGKPENKILWSEYLARKEAGSTEKEPYKLQGFIEGIEDGTKGDDLYKALASAHAPIVKYFGTKDLGLKLQRKDSEIMSNILIACAAQDIPVYPIHDSVLTQERHEEAIMDIMQRAYKKVMSASIGISKK